MMIIIINAKKKESSKCEAHFNAAHEKFNQSTGLRNTLQNMRRGHDSFLQMKKKGVRAKTHLHFKMKITLMRFIFPDVVPNAQAGIKTFITSCHVNNK